MCGREGFKVLASQALTVQRRFLELWDYSGLAYHAIEHLRVASGERGQQFGQFLGVDVNAVAGRPVGDFIAHVIAQLLDAQTAEVIRGVDGAGWTENMARGQGARGLASQGEEDVLGTLHLPTVFDPQDSVGLFQRVGELGQGVGTPV
jgi:hypothetical protein